MPKETTPSVAEPLEIMSLVDEFAEARHKCGAPEYNSTSNLARLKVVKALAALAASQAASHSAPEPAGYLIDPGAGSAMDRVQRDKPSESQMADIQRRGGSVTPLAPLGAESKACASVGVALTDAEILRGLSDEPWPSTEASILKWGRALLQRAALASPAPSVGMAQSINLPDMPDLRWHGEYRRGFAQCLSQVQELNATPPAEAPSECLGDPGECPFNSACMYSCGATPAPAEPVAALDDALIIKAAKKAANGPVARGHIENYLPTWRVFAEEIAAGIAPQPAESKACASVGVALTDAEILRGLSDEPWPSTEASILKWGRALLQRAALAFPAPSVWEPVAWQMRIFNARHGWGTWRDIHKESFDLPRDHWVDQPKPPEFRALVVAAPPAAPAVTERTATEVARAWCQKHEIRVTVPALAELQDLLLRAPASAVPESPADPLRVACVTLDGSTLTVPVAQLGDVLHGEDDQHTYTLTLKTMTRAEFDALGEFNGF